jgi:hypothetical protein
LEEWCNGNDPQSFGSGKPTGYKLCPAVRIEQGIFISDYKIMDYKAKELNAPWIRALTKFVINNEI